MRGKEDVIRGDGWKEGRMMDGWIDRWMIGRWVIGWEGGWMGGRERERENLWEGATENR